VEDRTVKAKLEVTKISLLMMQHCTQAVERVPMTFIATAAGWGLTVSLR